ncbi:MAG: hypothetical protein HYY93_06245 [Planctomycetes bacterium]|nr:hypothetical protein [Planctomycetota bacterium]
MNPQEKKAHKIFAVGLFNHTWTLLDRKRRSKEEDDEMVHAAHASRFHWGKVGTAKNLAIGEWQISRVYAVLKRADPALYHARRNLDLCRAHRIGDFTLAFAYEALARASAVAGRRGEARRYLKMAERVGARIREKEDRELLEKDLKSIRVS